MIKITFELFKDIGYTKNTHFNLISIKFCVSYNCFVIYNKTIKVYI